MFFLHTLCVFRSPYSLTMMHFMHHTMHVLDAPVDRQTATRRHSGINLGVMGPDFKTAG